VTVYEDRCIISLISNLDRSSETMATAFKVLEDLGYVTFSLSHRLIYLFVHLFIYAFMHLCIYVFMYLCIYAFMHLCIYPLSQVLCSSYHEIAHVALRMRFPCMFQFPLWCTSCDMMSCHVYTVMSCIHCDVMFCVQDHCGDAFTGSLQGEYQSGC
jgi:hypothetical protein